MEALLVGTMLACVPDASITTPGIYPDTLARAYATHPYGFVVQFKFPTDTVVNGVRYIIDSARIDTVLGLPPGLGYSCNVPDCKYLGGENGCLELGGTPADTGTYLVRAVVISYVRQDGSTTTLPTVSEAQRTLVVCTADSVCPTPVTGVEIPALERTASIGVIYTLQGRVVVRGVGDGEVCGLVPSAGLYILKLTKGNGAPRYRKVVCPSMVR